MFSYEVNDHRKTATAISTTIKTITTNVAIANEIFIYTSLTFLLRKRANNIQYTTTTTPTTTTTTTNTSDSTRSNSIVDNDTGADAYAYAYVDDDDNVNVAILNDSKAHFDASVTIQKNGLCSKYHTKC